ncbi:VOC family protein [Qaidamihabitans albus]|uniref:VOC family protein n=1 Tax=Qaidamihabitans albus TaxID=2795733 RepID=UPI0018F1EF7F|nr:VOC family protein [Qaidamihabitans albus]
MSTITTFLWFDDQAEEAAKYYTSVIGNSRITDVSRGPDGSVMVVGFELDGQRFAALNGGPRHVLTEAVSIQVSPETQAEVDELWAKLSDGGEEGPCGWLKDRYGLSWQVIPTALTELLTGSDSVKARRVAEAMFGMKKIDIQGLREAHAQA